jgi:hypothetical protein
MAYICSILYDNYPVKGILLDLSFSSPEKWFRSWLQRKMFKSFVLWTDIFLGPVDMVNNEITNVFTSIFYLY